ncbi:spore coat protein GerQ [Alkalihalobacterium bogoriense]|uniref:spore coat protein GerQ n=1 Tax=Alkalihalobacterium bogoriense TaxID=246272 RepID=UPI0005568497|nr:spore coat protein GerQ [Alkalihalobacterium bogoriense]
MYQQPQFQQPEQQQHQHQQSTAGQQPHQLPYPQQLHPPAGQQQPPMFYAPQPQFQLPPMQQFPQIPGMLPMEQSYIENILRLNRGKQVTVYMTFENNVQWNAQIFTGIIEEAGRDHIILQDPESEVHYLLLMVYLDYIVFQEHPEYDYPFGAAVTGQIATYSPR